MKKLRFRLNAGLCLGYLSLLLCAFTCKNETEVTPTVANFRIKGGSSFGMCIGYCQTEFEVSSQKISMVRKAQGGRGTGNNLPDKTCERSISSQDWTNLVNAITASERAFQQLPERVGCPDCADGGTEWIEIIREDGVKRVNFEFGKTVPEISNLITEMRKARESMNNCE